MNRIDRLHAILTHLQSKKRVTAQEIADRFNISLRTVYRDVKALDESGVPVIGEAGSGYSIMEGYRLPPVMFTREEAAALLMGGKLAEQLTDASVKKEFEAALFKIKAVLRGADKEGLKHLEETIAVGPSLTPPDSSSSQYINALQKSLIDKRVIFIRYLSNNGAVTERLVEPIGLYYYSMGWHLISWCRLRGGYRDFKINSIERLQVKDEVYDTANRQSLQQYINSVVKHSDVQEAVICLEKRQMMYIRNQKYYFGFVREEDLGDWVRLHFLTMSLEGLAHWLLMFTDSVKIEAPDRLGELVKSLAKKAWQHYQ